LLTDENWTTYAIKIIENITNSTYEGFQNKKNLGYYLLDYPWNYQDEFELNMDN